MDWMDIRNLVKRNHALGLCSLVFVRYGYGFNIHFLGFFLKEAERHDMTENLNKSRKKKTQLVGPTRKREISPFY